MGQTESRRIPRDVHFFTRKAVTFAERTALLIRAYVDARRDPAFNDNILACYPAVYVDMLDHFCDALSRTHQAKPLRKAFPAGSVNANIAHILDHRLFHIHQMTIVPELPMQILLLAAIHTAPTSPGPQLLARASPNSFAPLGALPQASSAPLELPSPIRAYLYFSAPRGAYPSHPTMFLRAAANLINELKIMFGERHNGDADTIEAAAAIARVAEEATRESGGSPNSFAPSALGVPSNSFAPSALGVPSNTNASFAPFQPAALSPFASLLGCTALRRVELDTGFPATPVEVRRLLPTVIGHLPPSVEHLSMVLLSGSEYFIEHWRHPLPATVTSVEVCANVEVLERGLGTFLARARHIRTLTLHSGNIREGVRHIPRILEDKPLLETLTLENTAVDLPELRAIKGCTRLERLDLERVVLVGVRAERAAKRLGREAGRTLEGTRSEANEFSRGQTNSFAPLGVPSNSFAPLGVPSFVEELATLGRSLPRLRSVSFRRLRGDDGPFDMVDLARGLQGSNIESFTGLGTFTQDLAAALALAPALRSLSFDVFHLRTSLPFLVEFIRAHGTRLRELRIRSSTLVSDQSLLLRDEPLAEALAHCPYLRSIELPYSISFARSAQEKMEFCQYIARVIASVGKAAPSLERIHSLQEIPPQLLPRGESPRSGEQAHPGLDLIRKATEETNRWRRREATGHAWAVVVANIQQNRERRFRERQRESCPSSFAPSALGAPTSSFAPSALGAPTSSRAVEPGSDCPTLAGTPSLRSEFLHSRLESVPTHALWTIHDFLPRNPVEVKTI